jgi:hypothetical protein
MNPIESVHVAPTTETKTEPGRFERALRSAAQAVAGGVASSVALAAPYVPGGMILSAAIRGAASPGARAALDGGAGGAGPEGDLLDATRTLQRESQAFNVRYLELQEAMQRESREFTTLTNVMKVKHDTAKAAITNIH